MFGDSWSPPTAADAYGINFAPSAGAVPESGLSSVAAPSIAGARAENPLHPENPLVVFGVLAALTFGLMAFSTSVRVAGTTASVSVGTT